MKIWKTMVTFVAIGLLSASQVIANIKTPSHVYQQTERIISEIKLIRAAMNTVNIPREPGVQVKKKPIHVYGKSLELLEKIARVQSAKGMMPVKVGTIPLTKITPGFVWESADIVLSELRRLKDKLGIRTNISEPKLVGGKSPSNVYENMWRASYLMDGVAGQISPSNVYRNTEIILRELKTIARKKGLVLTDVVPAVVKGKNPKDVNLQGFKNMHRIAKLQRKLKIEPMRVPEFPSGKITPSDVYDTTYNIMAELVRIKVALGIAVPQADTALLSGKTPSMVLSQMKLIGNYLKAMQKNM